MSERIAHICPCMPEVILELFPLYVTDKIYLSVRLVHNWLRTLEQPLIPESAFISGSHHETASPAIDATISTGTTLPSFEDICHLRCPTLRLVPKKARPAFASALSTTLRSILNENSEDAWLKLFMLPNNVFFQVKLGERVEDSSSSEHEMRSAYQHFTVVPRLTLVIAVLTSLCVLSTGQSLPCASNGQPCSDQLCPNTAVQLTCNIPNNKLGSTTQWMTSSPNCTLLLDQRVTYDCSGGSSSCPPFTAVNAEVTGPNLPCNTSTLSFMMSPNLNGTLITCATATVADIIGSITLNSVAPPGQPSVSVTPGLYDLMVMWTRYGCSPTHYTITLMGAGSVVRSSTSLTSTRFAGLLSDAAFSIAVVAINCAGNATTYVTTGTLPLPPTSIGVEQSKCSFTQNVETTSALYIVTMASINAVGVGPWSDPKQGPIALKLLSRIVVPAQPELLESWQSLHLLLQRPTVWIKHLHYYGSFPCDEQPQNCTPEGVPAIGLFAL
ncbi:hypothetical protein EMCRGX_G015539 [Ephydatia muelleri]